MRLILRTQRAQAALKGYDPITDRDDDFAVLDGDVVIGRILFGVGDQWIWALNGVGSDLAEDLESAKATLKARYTLAWNQVRANSGLPKTDAAPIF